MGKANSGIPGDVMQISIGLVRTRRRF